jgi:GDP-L-fucose synthase
VGDSYFDGKKIAVLGGTGLIGSQLVSQLVGLGAKVRIVARNPPSFESPHISFTSANLQNPEECVGAIKGAEAVFNLAVYGGGILRNSTESGKILTLNLIMQSNIIEAVRTYDVERYLFPSSVCAYPGNLELMSEDDAWSGPPEKTHEGFGWAKRIGELQCKLYAEQYGLEIAIVRPTNSYGPRDNFDLRSSHVIPSLVRKAVEGQDPYFVWGNGSSKREFLYSEDVARGMILALDKYPRADPVNLGSGAETSIADLVELILDLAGYHPAKIAFDETKPIGQQRRICDISKAKSVLGFSAQVSLNSGLRSTIEWYRQNQRTPLSAPAFQ